MVYAKSDWLELGLKLLVSDGAAAIRIDRLCTEAGRTKGSFYHHFKDRNAYIADLTAYWEDKLISHVNSKIEPISDPVERIAMLKTLTSGDNANEERALRRWAGAEPIIAVGLARIDSRRVAYLARLWQEAKHISSQQAIDLATMEFATLIGLQHLYVPVTEDRIARIEVYSKRMIDNLAN